MLNSLKDNYSLICKIGEGSFSEVLKVQDKITGKFFAAKRLTKPFVNMKELDDYSELQVLKTLDHHPNILSLEQHVFEPEKGILTLIFNLMDCSLYDKIKDRSKKLTETRCKNYVFQLIQGIEFLHKSGIFHRDIKPENILIRVDEKLRRSNPNKAETIQLGDLGSVAPTERNVPYSEYVSTRWYRAPECLLTNGNYGPKMDIWALGCCFYEMLTLQPLFPGENEVDQLDKIHEILGSPSPQVLEKFHNFTNSVSFSKKVGVPWRSIIKNLSDNGVEVLKKMLIYHPGGRISAQRLKMHSYFDVERFRFSSSVRLPYSKSDSLKMEKPCSSRNLKSVQLSKSSTRSDPTPKTNDPPLNKYETVTKQYQHIKERNWNMNWCPKKREVENNLKLSARNAKSLNSSINSFH